MNQPVIRKHDLWAHQCDAYQFAVTRKSALCGLRMGEGKSCVLIALADNLAARRILVICPTTVRGVWRREFERHAARAYHVVILDKGTIKKRTEQARAATEPFAVVINYEAAWREPFREWALSQHWDMVILDESHRCQGRSQVSRFVRELKSECRYCASGTPLTQDPVSIWAQCQFLDPSVFPMSLKSFKRRYWRRNGLSLRKAVERYNLCAARVGLAPVEVSDYWTRGTKRTGEYLVRLADIAFRRENTVLDLPPLTIEKRTFELSPLARRLHDAVQSGFVDRIESGRWPAVQHSYAITMRLQEITSGWLEDTQGIVQTVDTGKAECLSDILDAAAGEPVVVFTRFVRDLDTVRALAEKFGLTYGEISQRRKDGLTSLATMSDVQVLGVQERAGGVGIDLTRSRIAVFYSLAWSLADYEQAIARLHRPPATQPVVVYQLVAEHSVDEELYLALAARKQQITYVWHGIALAAEVPST